jgi:integrase
VKRTVYRDTDTRGFICTVFPSGERTFALYRWLDGKPEREPLGSFSDTTVEVARTKAEKLIGKIANGENPTKRRRELRQEATFGSLFASYLTLHAKRKKRTWAEDERQFNCYLGEFARKKLSTITRSDIAKLHDEISLRGTYAANRVLALVRKVFNWAIEREDFKGANPAAKFQRNAEVKRDRFLDGGELPQFWRALAEEPNAVIRDYFLVALLTGARRMNVLAMAWNEIKWSRSTWTIPAAKFKTGKPHDVPLLPEVLALLRQRYEAPDRHPVWVFPSRGRSGHLVEPKGAWRRILRRAGLNNLRTHDLRRSLASWMAINGASLPVIGQALGHQSVETTAIYARLHSSAVREGMQRAIDSMLAELPGDVKLLPAEKDGDRE